MDYLNESITKVIAETNVFKIEKIESIGKNDFPKLIEISLHLAKEFGKDAILTKDTIRKYFNTEKSLPFVARYQGEIIGFIIGIPLESLENQQWVFRDEFYGKGNTLYTYAFVIMEKYKSNGYAKMLKRVYLSWAKNRRNFQFISGHVKSGVVNNKDSSIKIIYQEENWKGTGKKFDYYRRSLETNPELYLVNNPPIETTF
jgi:GNAT superfamily N-acetyltransferase